MISKRGLVMFSVFAVIAVLVVSVLTVNFVFAQDDADLAPFDATVTVANAPPIIVFLSDVNENTASDISPGVVDPVAGCGLAGAAVCPTVSVSFIARDPNGIANLDDATALVTYTYAGPGPRFFGPLGVVADCGVAGSFDTTGFNAVTDKNYTCDIIMRYYHDTGVAANAWDVLATVDDVGPLTATCGVGASVVCETFDHTSTTAVTAKALVGDPDVTVSWTGISVAAGDIDQAAVDFGGAGLTIFNRGNSDISTGGAQDLDLTGKDLRCQDAPTCNTGTDLIPSERFSAGGNTGDVLPGPPDTIADECQDELGTPAATELSTDSTLVPNIIGISLLYGDGVANNDEDVLYLCIDDAVDDLGLSDPVGYSTTAAASGGGPVGEAWEVTI